MVLKIDPKIDPKIVATAVHILSRILEGDFDKGPMEIKSNGFLNLLVLT